MPDTPALTPDTVSPDRRETVALVIPLYHEEAMLPILVAELDAFRTAHPYVTEVVLVDDGSRDRTREIARSLLSGRQGFTVVGFSRNFGHQLAVTAGLSVVTADAAVVLDADLQDPLDVIPRMVAAWRDGADVAYGVREAREGETAFKTGTASLFYRVFRWMTESDMPLDAGDFRLVSRRVLDAYNRLGEQQPFVRGLVAWLGFRQVAIPYRRAARAAGETKYPLRKMLRFALSGLTAFSDKPLRLASWLGFGTAALSILGLVWVLLVRLVWHDAIPGWSSLVFAAFFFGGVQLFFLGVLGLYVGRVFDEVRGRPRYVVEEVWRSEEMAPVRSPDLTGVEPT